MIQKHEIRDQDQDEDTKDVGVKLSDLPELTLWDWIEQRPFEEYHQAIKDHGGWHDKMDEVPVELLGNFGDYESDIIDWMGRNRDLCNRKYYEERGFTAEEARPHMRYPSDIGFCERNVGEYCFGIKGDSDFQLKELIGGQKAFDQMQMQMDNSLVRLLVYMPGNGIPYHLDNYINWGETFAHLNPKIMRGPDVKAAFENDPNVDRFGFQEQSVCDEGKVVRRFCTVSEWSTGHFLMLENTFFPKWDAGDVYNVPMGIYHLSGNMGFKLKITMIVTGVESK